MKIIILILDALAKAVHGLLSWWKVLHVIAKIDGKHRDTPEATWMFGGGIEIPCIYFFYGANSI